MARRATDLTGKRIGFLVCIRLDGTTTGRNYNWTCRCDCGAEVSRSTGYLRQAVDASCNACGKKSWRVKWHKAMRERLPQIGTTR